MSVSIVVGGQFGSEGKGKVAHYLAHRRKAVAVVRVGGPNSGHTAGNATGLHILRQLPTAALLSEPACVLASGCYVDPVRLFDEIASTGLSPDRLKIDPWAVIVEDKHRTAEKESSLRDLIGSTLSGTGGAVIERMSRCGSIKFAKDEPDLAPFLVDTKTYLRALLDRNARVVVEGTQGFGLSPLHSPHYPFVTSRDTTAAGFLAETGLSPLDVDEIALVIRTFPIRVSGNSGPLENECSWGDVTLESGSNGLIEELTSVTRTVRRVARFSPEIVRRAIAVNRPNLLILNHVDYWDAKCHGQTRLSDRALQRLREVERGIGRRVDLAGTDGTVLIEMSRSA